MAPEIRKLVGMSGDTTATTDLHIDKKQKLDVDSDSDLDDEPALEWDPDDDYLQDIVSDISLEIGLRERLLQTVQSRIEWALRLQGCLTSGASDNPQLTDFKTVALDALSAIDAPAEILFSRDEPAPPLDTRRPSFVKKLRKKPTVREQLAKKTGKFLYIILEGNTDPSILRCPVCLRTEFSSLQGLFNHARGTHALGWSSHDECVKHCACKLEQVQGGPVDFTDLDAGVEVGAGTGGILPGLSSLFEQAVVDHDDPEFEGLNRTLGYHANTPALAPYLGREPVQRQIMVWDPDVVVDIDGFDDEKPHAKPRWRMPFSHRNVFREGQHAPPQLQISTAPPPEIPVPPRQTNATNVLPAPSSRFHIVTRIVVVDRSLWLPPEQRPGHDTHKWMISVDAPSYTHHITTVLRGLRVFSPTEALFTAAPPFAVIGTAHTPFLARIELSFSSATSSGVPQKILLEHWVELDRMQSSGVVHGDEQMVDIELDRGTIFLPLQTGYIPVSARVLWDMDLGKERHTPLDAATDVVPPELTRSSSKDGRKTRNAIPKVKMTGSWQNVLRKLVERFPLTVQEIKGGKRPVPALPYKLVDTPAQFASLVMGRKKAVEWGRAMAMRDAYSDAVLGGLTEDVTILSTADIFAWLHTNGYFPKGTATIKKAQDHHALKTGLCRVCGLAYSIHPAFSEPSAFNRGPNGVDESFVCQVVPMEWQLRRFPILDISRLLPQRRQRQNAAPADPAALITSISTSMSEQKSGQRLDVRVADSIWDSRARVLLAASNPNLITAVRRLVSVLKLSTFTNPTPPVSLDFPQFPINPALSAVEVKADVAPYAMLALLIKPFVRALVVGGLDVSARDRHRALVPTDGRPRRHTASSDRDRRMLTPSHIVRGVVARGWDWNDELGGCDDEVPCAKWSTIT
ncbi:hypothetical protein MSAN_02172400 [Mycena sanguinolenta]|uniref:YEATS domain-containing protein n=1 Tax=Mycena sanguinolenta TaxID=230812 RepID=A0A8H7CJ42_9AGAR|nr:hypothetical protein MSAN_02172400 [Mycena sanguinolenta]